MDLALIDLRLGHGESGLALEVAIRQRLGLPIGMLTGRGDEMDKNIGLETGADDYGMKPFNPRALIARLRDCAAQGGPAPALPDRTGSQVLAFGQMVLDLRRRELMGPRAWRLC